MAGCALRGSASTASPDSITSITSQPSRIEARWNGQPAGSSVQGTPLPLGIRPWPGKVKAIFSTVGSIVPGDEVLANKRTNAPANPDASQARLPSWKTLGGPCGPDRPGGGGCVPSQSNPQFALPAAGERLRCGACGNLTRFDVVSTRRTSAFWHYSLAGELTVEEERALEASAEEVRCRWCGSTTEVEVVPALWAAAGTEPAERWAVPWPR